MIGEMEKKNPKKKDKWTKMTTKEKKINRRHYNEIYKKKHPRS